ncbi:MAG TPA: hypothetical protein VGM38_08735, partial [Pseudolysinimonas sp.]
MAEPDDIRFSIQLPNNWFELDVRPRTRDLTIGLLIENRVREQPELWPHRSELTKVLRRQARDAWDAGARYCACFVLVIEQSIIPGSVMVSVLPSPPGGATPDAVAESLPIKEPADDGDTWSRRSMVDLPLVGRAARREGVLDIPLPDGRTSLRSIVQQTFVPLPDGRLLLVAGSSPALDLVEPLL